MAVLRTIDSLPKTRNRDDNDDEATLTEVINIATRAAVEGKETPWAVVREFPIDEEHNEKSARASAMYHKKKWRRRPGIEATTKRLGAVVITAVRYTGGQS